MTTQSLMTETQARTFRVWREELRLETRRPLQFVDLTDRVIACVARSGVRDGLVNVQTRHTTTAIVVNEHEPLLLDDLADLLERAAPRQHAYRHDRADLRTVNLVPEERPNGHAHARAFLLGSSECLNVVDGRLQLGRWQRIFLVELDGTRRRRVSILVLGTGPAGRNGAPDFLPLEAEELPCE